jgi:asparagine synthase (glutamine-hydrolysing)
MAVLAGLYNTTGAPIEPELVARVNKQGRILNPDYSNVYVSGSLALAVQHLASTPEAKYERQPVASTSSSCRIILDGRIDNRDELMRLLFTHSRAPTYITDSALILAAYEAWGLDCARRIVGDFAWVIWDENQRRLVGARDPFGSRPFFYAYDGRLFACASQLDQVRKALPVCIENLNEEFLADFFVTGRARLDVTPYKAIKRLPHGHLLILDSSGLRVQQYWDLEDQPKIHYQDAREYSELFRELLRDAVRLHLRSDRPVWGELSGGLDSSSIVSVAAQQLASDGDQEFSKFGTLSLVFNESKRSDEREWQAHVIREYGVKNYQVEGDTHHPFQDAVEGARYHDMPTEEIFFFAAQREMVRLMADHGVRVLLRGIGAEYTALSEWVPPMHLADLLQQKRFAVWTRELMKWQATLHEPLATVAYKYGIGPFLRPGTISIRPYGGVPKWLNPSFVRRLRVKERMERSWQPRRFERVSDQWQYEQFGHLMASQATSYLHKACDIRNPFLYRPLYEFAFRVPWEQKVMPGAYKVLLRQAMRGILPEAVRTRTKLVLGDNAIYTSFGKEWKSLHSLLETSWLVKAGIVDRSELEREFQLAKHRASQFLPGVLRPLAVEAWLRSRIGEPGAS